jgi:succinate dehydrogenase/fumarate reductase flavoprotein subunit
MISNAADLLVIGAGTAGLRAPIAVDDQHARVLVRVARLQLRARQSNP